MDKEENSIQFLTVKCRDRIRVGKIASAFGIPAPLQFSIALGVLFSAFSPLVPIVFVLLAPGATRQHVAPSAFWVFPPVFLVGASMAGLLAFGFRAESLDSAPFLSFPYGTTAAGIRNK
jgi:hypothetical protein